MSRSLGVGSAAASAVSSELRSDGKGFDSSSSSSSDTGHITAKHKELLSPSSLIVDPPLQGLKKREIQIKLPVSYADKKSDTARIRENPTLINSVEGNTQNSSSRSHSHSHSSDLSSNGSGSGSNTMSDTYDQRNTTNLRQRRKNQQKYQHYHQRRRRNANEQPRHHSTTSNISNRNPYSCDRPLHITHVLEFYLNKSQWMLTTPLFPSISPDPLYRKSTDEGTFASTNRVLYSRIVKSHHIDMKAIDIVIDECNRIIRSTMWFPHLVYLIPWLCIPLGLVVYVVESGHDHKEWAFRASLIFLVGGVGGLMFAMRLWRTRWLRVLELLTETLDAYNYDFEELDIHWEIQCDVPVLAGRSYGRAYYKLKMMLGHRHYHRLKLQYDKYLERRQNHDFSLSEDRDISIMESRTVTKRDHSLSTKKQPIPHGIDYSARFSVDSANTMLSDESNYVTGGNRKASQSFGSLPAMSTKGGSTTGLESIKGVAPISADLSSMMSPIPTIGSDTPTLKRTVTSRFYQSGFIEKPALIRKQASLRWN